MDRIGTLLVAPTTERKAEPGRFATALKGATSDLVSGLAGGVALAAPYLPGGAVLAGALRPTLPPLSTASAPGSAGSLGTIVGTGVASTVGARATSGPSPAAGPLAPAPLSPGPASVGAAFGTGTGGDLIEATRALQAQSQTFNLQYLELQESMQRESREFTSLTNVMKVRHDSAKAAIGNIH